MTGMCGTTFRNALSSASLSPWSPGPTSAQAVPQGTSHLEVNPAGGAEEHNTLGGVFVRAM